MAYAKEYLEISKEIKQGETISFPFGPPTAGKIIIIIDRVFETLFSNRIMSNPSTNSGPSVPAASAGTALYRLNNSTMNTTTMGAGLLVDDNFPPPPPPPKPGNPDLVSYELKNNNGVVFSGSGKIREFELQSVIPNIGVALASVYPWTMAVTNNSNKDYSVQFRIFFTGNRKIEKAEIDLEAVQKELDRFFNQPDDPLRIILENRRDREVPNPNQWGQPMLVPQTHFELQAPTLLLIALQKYPEGIKMPLGKKYLHNDRIQSNPIKVKASSIDGKFALRIDLSFHFDSNNAIRFSDNDILGFWDSAVDIELKIHRFYCSVFVILDNAAFHKISIQTRINRASSYFEKGNHVSVVGKNLPHFSGDDFNTKIIGMMEQSIDTAISDYLAELNRNRDKPIHETLIELLFGNAIPTDFLGYEQRLWVTYAGEKPSIPVNQANMSTGITP